MCSSSTNSFLKTFSLVDAFFRPVSSFRLLFCISWAVMCIFLSYRYNVRKEFDIEHNSELFSMFMCLVPSYIMCLLAYLASLANKKLGCVVGIFFCSVSVLLAVIETWLVHVYHMGFDYTTVMLLFQTNARESREFLSMAFSMASTYAVFFSYVAVAACFYFLRGRLSSVRISRCVKFILLVFFIYCFRGLVREYRSASGKLDCYNIIGGGRY